MYLIIDNSTGAPDFGKTMVQVANITQIKIDSLRHQFSRNQVEAYDFDFYRVEKVEGIKDAILRYGLFLAKHKLAARDNSQEEIGEMELMIDGKLVQCVVYKKTGDV